MAEKYQLTKIFNDVCYNVTKIPELRHFEVQNPAVKSTSEEQKTAREDFFKSMGYRLNRLIIVEETDEVEKSLENYILNTVGYHIYKLYMDYKKGIVPNFEYFPEVRRAFENLVVNYKFTRSHTIEEWIKEYSSEFRHYIEGFPYVDKLLEAITSIYGKNYYDVAVAHVGRTFMLYHPSDKNEDELPMICIQDIERLNKIIEDYIAAIKLTDNAYKYVFDETMCMTEDEAIKEILGWTLRNASQADLSNIELFFSKYLNYVIDTTFDAYKKSIVFAGNIYDDEHYIALKRAALSYETPYYLRFMLKEKHVEFPNIRFGIEWTSGEKVVHVQAIQASQEVTPNEAHKDLCRMITKSLPKNKYFREFNPMHLASLVEFIGMINAWGIKKIIACDYFALRYQRYCLENNKNEEELHAYQHRLTNKYTNTFFRLLEYTEDIHVLKYPDESGEFIFKITGDVKFSSPILQEIYDIGYNSAKCQGSMTPSEDILECFSTYCQDEQKRLLI